MDEPNPIDVALAASIQRMHDMREGNTPVFVLTAGQQYDGTVEMHVFRHANDAVAHARDYLDAPPEWTNGTDGTLFARDTVGNRRFHWWNVTVKEIRE